MVRDGNVNVGQCTRLTQGFSHTDVFHEDVISEETY